MFDKMLALLKFFVLSIIIIDKQAVGEKNDDCETSIFCYGRLLHDVQVHELFKHPRDFLELQARKSPEYLGLSLRCFTRKTPLKFIRQGSQSFRFLGWLESNVEHSGSKQIVEFRYREIRPKLKLSGTDGRDVLKDFIRQNFANRSSSENASPPDWSAKLPFQTSINDPITLEFLQVLNRKWTQCYYNVTEEARMTRSLHATLPTRHPFYGSTKSLDYGESWWLYQGLVSSGMVVSARELLENLAGLVDEYGHVPPENRVYFLGRSSPPFLAIMLEDYFNKTGDLELVGRLLPYAEIDFHYWVQSTTRKFLSAFDVFLAVNQIEVYISKPRPERYLEDWKRKPKNSTQGQGLNVGSMIWDSDPPRGTLSVRLTAITEWAARVLARLSQDFGGPKRRQMYSLISWELQHTLDTLLYSRKKRQWMDYSSEYGHVNDVSLWPVYTGARPWMPHYKVPRNTSLDENLVSAVVLQDAKLLIAAKEVALLALTSAAHVHELSLRNSSVAITLLRMFPEVHVPGTISPPVHTRILLVAIPMVIATIICLPFLFIKRQISK